MSAESERAADQLRAAAFSVDTVGAAAALLEAIPADITTGPAGEPLDEEEVEGIRRSRAREWALAGFTDPAQVAAWIHAGVVQPRIAETARRRGFRPADPWVPRGWGFAGTDWLHDSREPVAGPAQRHRNRRHAQRAWTERARRLAAGQRRQDQLAAILRENVIAGSGSTAAFTAFDMALGASTGPDPELIAGTAVTISSHADTLADLAAATKERLATRTRAETAAWLLDTLTAGQLPTGGLPTDALPVDDTVPPRPDSGSLQRWLARQADCLADHSGYVHAFIEPVLDHLHRLEPAEAATLRTSLDLAAQRLHTAQHTWTAITDPT